MLNDAEYVKHRGSKCPFCQTENIEGGDIDFDSAMMSQKMSCHYCEQEWVDLYSLTGWIPNDRI
jgi:transposase-like protein